MRRAPLPRPGLNPRPRRREPRAPGRARQSAAWLPGTQRLNSYRTHAARDRPTPQRERTFANYKDGLRLILFNLLEPTRGTISSSSLFPAPPGCGGAVSRKAVADYRTPKPGGAPPDSGARRVLCPGPSRGHAINDNSPTIVSSPIPSKLKLFVNLPAA